MADAPFAQALTVCNTNKDVWTHFSQEAVNARQAVIEFLEERLGGKGSGKKRKHDQWLPRLLERLEDSAEDVTVRLTTDNEATVNDLVLASLIFSCDIYAVHDSGPKLHYPEQLRATSAILKAQIPPVVFASEASKPPPIVLFINTAPASKSPRYRLFQTVDGKALPEPVEFLQKRAGMHLNLEALSFLAQRSLTPDLGALNSVVREEVGRAARGPVGGSNA